MVRKRIGKVFKSFKTVTMKYGAFFFFAFSLVFFRLLFFPWMDTFISYSISNFLFLVEKCRATRKWLPYRREQNFK